MKRIDWEKTEKHCDPMLVAKARQWESVAQAGWKFWAACLLVAVALAIGCVIEGTWGLPQ